MAKNMENEMVTGVIGQLKGTSLCVTRTTTAVPILRRTKRCRDYDYAHHKGGGVLVPQPYKLRGLKLASGM